MLVFFHLHLEFLIIPITKTTNLKQNYLTNIISVLPWKSEKNVFVNFFCKVTQIVFSSCLCSVRSVRSGSRDVCRRWCKHPADPQSVEWHGVQRSGHRLLHHRIQPTPHHQGQNMWVYILSPNSPPLFCCTITSDSQKKFDFSLIVLANKVFFPL